MTGAFIISSGRCGSTMMSNLINTHADILSVSEFFIDIVSNGYELDAAFGSEQIDGQEFWQRINFKPPIMNVLLANERPYPEMLYPYRDPASRFRCVGRGRPALGASGVPQSRRALPGCRSPPVSGPRSAGTPRGPLPRAAPCFRPASVETCRR